jgi:hypothetical protein
MLLRKKTFEEADHKAETEITKKEKGVVLQRNRSQKKDMGQRNWGFNTIKKNKIQTFLGIKTHKKQLRDSGRTDRRKEILNKKTARTP